MKKIFFAMTMMFVTICHASSPINGLLERIDKGASKKFIIEQTESDIDFFELDQRGDKVVIKGNNFVSIASGINWYLKYYANVNLCWNNMKAELPSPLPAVTKSERHETSMKWRYDLNYCTYSYSMPFWDWKRWEQEIDWMALHGINMPLSIVGIGSVWKNVLTKLGYTKKEVNEFVAGPAFQAWWLMNNLEGWGGPNPDEWYNNQELLQKQILKRMHEYGIEPIFPGYSGMVPANSKEKLGLDVANPGQWTGYRRPAILQPSDPNFQKIAKLYYSELTKLFGKAKFYSMDPFHEGGNAKGVDLDAAGKAIWKAMKSANPKSTWVIQAWGACPFDAMIKNIPAGDMIVLDLYSENRPQWGDPSSSWYRKQGFRQHDWLYCMLLNFGGNVGLFGKMQHVIDGFFKAKESDFSSTLSGVGITMEGMENNPVMYELLCELPWHENKFSKDEWLRNYTRARYGKSNTLIDEGWLELSNTIYNCPDEAVQQGTHESVLCARPSLDAYQVSTWSEMKDYYQPMDIIRTAGKFVRSAEEFRGNNNFEYDLIDIVRQAVAEKGRLVYPVVVSAYKSGDKKLFDAASSRFLELILLQDKLLSSRKEFKIGTWIERARNMGISKEAKDLYEWNARVQVTTWGNRYAAEEGGLHDYAHKEWNGLLKDFYYVRWKTYFDELHSRLDGNKAKEIDFYIIEEKWTKQQNHYDSYNVGDVVDIATSVYNKLIDF